MNLPTHLLPTTVVGSYPVPAWLAAMPSTVHLRDAVMVVLKTQELAGLDLIADGELSRFDRQRASGVAVDPALGGGRRP